MKYIAITFSIAFLSLTGCLTKVRVEPLSVYLEGYNSQQLPLYRGGRSSPVNNTHKYHSKSHFYSDPFYKSPVWAGILTASGDLSLEMELRNGVYVNVEFQLAYIEEYITAIETFIKWQKLAEQRGDYFIKEIYQSSRIYIGFYTNSGTGHYLALAPVSLGIPLDNATMYFTPTYANVILDLLYKHKNGELNRQNLNEIYKRPSELGSGDQKAYVF